MVFRFANLGQIRAKFGEFVELQYCPDKLKTVARIIRHFAFPLSDHDFLVAHRFIVEVCLIPEMKGVGLKIESLRPRGWNECGEGAKGRK